MQRHRHDYRRHSPKRRGKGPWMAKTLLNNSLNVAFWVSGTPYQQYHAVRSGSARRPHLSVARARQRRRRRRALVGPRCTLHCTTGLVRCLIALTAGVLVRLPWTVERLLLRLSLELSSALASLWLSFSSPGALAQSPKTRGPSTLAPAGENSASPESASPYPSRGCPTSCSRPVPRDHPGIWVNHLILWLKRRRPSIVRRFGMVTYRHPVPDRVRSLTHTPRLRVPKPPLCPLSLRRLFVEIYYLIIQLH